MTGFCRAQRRANGQGNRQHLQLTLRTLRHTFISNGAKFVEKMPAQDAECPFLAGRHNGFLITAVVERVTDFKNAKKNQR
ncbi:hypothetical protein [Thiorhodospira sibirica]|uniref:hypothetical protein n=1 Tax=Thiorhodospira sibirica TaxID=154347 RepID=UPI001111BE36|nr:hypothetical protein [Thiorhodospira sibirica]